MPKGINKNDPEMIGTRFGKLVVVSFAGMNVHGKRIWNCKCDCGGATITPTGDLRSGKALACSCVRNKKTARLKLKHGLWGTPEYRTWMLIKRRCCNKNCVEYPDYGGRGIRVCERWSDSFESFLEDMGKRPIGRYSIERVDVNGNYCPDNCVWMELKYQSRNTRKSRMYTHNGMTMCLMDWSEYLGICYQTLQARVHLRKWEPPKLFQPTAENGSKRRVEIKKSRFRE